MSATHLRHASWILLAALGAFTGSTRADDLLDRKQREQAVAAQKALADANTFLNEARKLETTNPAEAKGLLRRAEFLVEDARGLSERQRAELLAQIRARLRQVDATLREREIAEREAAERELVRQGQKSKKGDPLRPSNPGNPYTRPSDFIKNGNNVLTEAQRLKLQREQGAVAIQRETMQTVSQMVEQRFTERYKYKMQNGMYGQKLTKEEKELLAMLNSTLSVDFNKTTFKEVLDYISTKTDDKLKIFVDENSLREASIEYDDPVTFKIKKATVRTILKKVLADRGLTYIIKEAAIHVMTPARAREFAVTRAYPVADLLGVQDPRFGPFVNRVQQLQAAQQLMLLIVNTIEPASWQVNGGMGTISFHEPSMSIVVRHTAEMHYQLGGGLGR